MKNSPEIIPIHLYAIEKMIDDNFTVDEFEFYSNQIFDQIIDFVAENNNEVKNKLWEILYDNNFRRNSNIFMTEFILDIIKVICNKKTMKN